MPVFKTLTDGRVPVRIWTNDINAAAEAQLANVASMLFVFHHVAAMPDVHVGIGATIGAVIATKDAVMPAAAGVDIGCGMLLQKTNLTAGCASAEKLGRFFEAALKRIPVGMRERAEKDAAYEDCAPLEDRLAAILAKHPKILEPMRTMNWRRQLGTLGSGNHFIELVRDEAGVLWLLLHSGSRGAGNVMASHFIRLAKAQMQARGVSLPDPALAFFEKGEPLFEDYLATAAWATDYASINRAVMARDAMRALEAVFPGAAPVDDPIDCHHNFVALETHFGESVYVTRKGAIRAGAGELGIVPGSMGAASYLVEGLGSADAFDSCAHGAGRRLGRKAAALRFSTADLERETAGIVCRKDAGVLDEIPSAYKPIDEVMSNQRDLARVVHTFRQLVCIKG